MGLSSMRRFTVRSCGRFRGRGADIGCHFCVLGRFLRLFVMTCWNFLPLSLVFSRKAASKHSDTQMFGGNLVGIHSAGVVSG